MKKTNSSLSSDTIKAYFHIIKSTPSKSDALKLIADSAINDFGEYITPGNLKLTDEIIINLIELIDQIIYEFRDNIDNEPAIKDYIIDDLYSKLSLTLEALNSPEIYLANIKNRSLFPDDLIIIRNKHITDIIPLLVSEYEGITNLQHEIIKTLIYFPEETGIDFYLNSYKNTASGFIKAASILGIRYASSKGINTEAVKQLNNGMTDLILFAERFNEKEINKNPMPLSKEELTFTLLHIEKNINQLSDMDSMRWIINLLLTVPSFIFENSWFCEVNTSIGNILLKTDLNVLKKILKNEQFLIKTMSFIDLMPGKIFNRLTGRFDEMGIEFLASLNHAIEKKKVIIESDNSNILNYLCWNSTETF
jgi:hypothetical protein